MVPRRMMWTMDPVRLALAVEPWRSNADTAGDIGDDGNGD